MFSHLLRISLKWFRSGDRLYYTAANEAILVVDEGDEVNSEMAA